MVFEDRTEAGKKLGQMLLRHRSTWNNSVVLALPRGGVPVAFEVASALDVPLDVVIVRKLGVPGQQELAMGAIASGGTLVRNDDVIQSMKISPELLESVAIRERLHVHHREQTYRNCCPPVSLENRTIILVDDGLATGASMLAAARSLKPRVKEIVVAVPVASQETCRMLRREVHDIFCLATPRGFVAVSNFYRKFDQTADRDVQALLATARERASQAA